MSAGMGMFICLLPVTVGFAVAGWMMTYRLAPEPEQPATSRWLRAWSLKGLAFPALLWITINIGLGWSLQPFMPEIQAAQNGGGRWFAVYLGVLGQGFFVLSTYWAAITLGWAVVCAGRGLEGETRSDFRSLSLTCGLGMLVFAVLIFWLGRWPFLGLAALAILIPLAGYAPAILFRKKMPPMYARAVAKVKFGKYTEAEWEIIRQLENSEDDFEGWMMLAELYANHFKDFGEAEQAILDICSHPKVTPSQISVALHRLADWYLKMREDPEAARRALQMICDRLPGSHLARMARLRMNQLPASVDELRAQKTAQAIPLPALGDSLDEAPTQPESLLDRQKAVDLANACVKKLTLDPNLVAPREKLARLLAEHLDQADQAIDQLGQLLELPNQPAAKRVEWLSLIAAWHLKYRQDTAAGREVLQRILKEFPGTPQSLAARRRLQLLGAEARTQT